MILLRGKAVRREDVPDPLEPWLRSEARVDLAAAVERNRKFVTNQPTRLTIRDQRTLWGSCSSRGTLSFNFRLIMAPPPVLEYLAIHELIHLDVPNHSPEYWRRVAAACSAFKLHERWLKRYGSVLMRPLA